MTNAQMTLFGIAFIFIMTSLGSALVFCFKREIPQKLNAVMLGCASGIMIAASIWSLLLPAIEQASQEFGNFACFPIGIGFICGGLFLLILDKLTPCFWQKSGRRKGKRLSKAEKLFLAVTLHNIPEGLAVGFAFGAAYAVGTTSAFIAALGLAFGIGVQNFPEGTAVSLPVNSERGSKLKSFLLGVISGIAEVIFAIIGLFLSAYLQPLQPWLLAFSAGAMMFVVAEDLIPEANASGATASSAWGLMFGFLIMMILDVSL